MIGPDLPDNDAVKDWLRRGALLAARALPAQLCLLLVLYGAGAALHALAAPFGPETLLAADVATIAAMPAASVWAATALAARAADRASPLPVPGAFAPASALAVALPYSLALPPAWILINVMSFASGDGLITGGGPGHVFHVVGLGAFAGVAAAAGQKMRIARAQLMGADGGANPAGEPRQLRALSVAADRLSAFAFWPHFGLFIMASALWPPAMAVTVLTTSWFATACYLAVLEIVTGTRERAPETSAQDLPEGVS